MIISYKHKFVFIKTRKTAGSTLEYLIEPHLDRDTDICSGSDLDGTKALNFPQNWNGHLGKIYLSELVPQKDWWKMKSEWYVFTIERNPWDKCVSSYFWLRERWGKERFKFTFDEYILGYAPYSLPIDRNLYMYDDGSLITNKIFRYENLQEMTYVLNKKFNIDLSEDWRKTRIKNSSDRPKDYREMYKSPVLVDRVAERFNREIKLLGYTYE